MGHVSVLKTLMLSDADVGGERGTAVIALTIQHPDEEIPGFILDRIYPSMSEQRQTSSFQIDSTAQT